MEEQILELVAEVQRLRQQVTALSQGPAIQKGNYMRLKDFLKARNLTNDHMQYVFRTHDYLRKYKRTPGQTRGTVLINVTEYDKLFHN